MTDEEAENYRMQLRAGMEQREAELAATNGSPTFTKHTWGCMKCNLSIGDIHLKHGERLPKRGGNLICPDCKQELSSFLMQVALGIMKTKKIVVQWVKEDDYGYGKAMRVMESDHERFTVGSRFDFGFFSIATDEGYTITSLPMPNDQAQRPGLTAGVERNETKGKSNE